MTIEKIKVIDQITVDENGYVMIREATNIVDDGTVISKTYHRSSFYPGQDISDQPEKVKGICQSVWTPEVIQAHLSKQPNIEA